MWAHSNLLNSGFLFSFVDVATGGSNGRLEIDTTGRLRLINDITGVVAQTDINYWNQGQRHFVEMKHVVSDTVGLLQARIDEVVVLTQTNVDTKRTDATVGEVQFGDANGDNLWIDEVYLVNGDGTTPNDYLGDVTVLNKRPIGAGTFTDLTRGGTDSGANWSQLDDDGLGEADDVRSATADAKDTYDFGALGGTGTDPVHFVMLRARAQKSDAGAKFGRVIMRSGEAGNAIEESASETLGQGFAHFHHAYNQDPAGVAWTRAKVDAAEPGVKVKDA
jgi:hypothetical protein